jgi:hypothetical protein
MARTFSTRWGSGSGIVQFGGPSESRADQPRAHLVLSRTRAASVAPRQARRSIARPSHSIAKQITSRWLAFSSRVKVLHPIRTPLRR